MIFFSFGEKFETIEDTGEHFIIASSRYVSIYFIFQITLKTYYYKVPKSFFTNKFEGLTSESIFQYNISKNEVINELGKNPFNLYKTLLRQSFLFGVLVLILIWITSLYL